MLNIDLVFQGFLVKGEEEKKVRGIPRDLYIDGERPTDEELKNSERVKDIIYKKILSGVKITDFYYSKSKKKYEVTAFPLKNTSEEGLLFDTVASFGELAGDTWIEGNTFVDDDEKYMFRVKLTNYKLYDDDKLIRSLTKKDKKDYEL